jgi:hypothetical protein
MKNLFKSQNSKNQSMKKVTLDIRKKSFISSVQEFIFNLKNLLKLQNISFAVLLFLFSLNSQAQYPLPNQYGYYVANTNPSIFCNQSGNSCFTSLVTSTTSNHCSNFLNTFKNKYITKKSNSLFSIQTDNGSFCQLVTCNNSQSPSNIQTSQTYYMEFSNNNMLYNNGTGTFSNTSGITFNQSSLAATTSLNAQSTYIDNSIIYRSYNTRAISCGPHLTFNRNIELNNTFKIFEVYSSFLYQGGITYYNHGANYKKTCSYIVTDPKNWSTYTTEDYDVVSWTPSVFNNLGQKVTRNAELYNPLSGNITPQNLINSSPDTNIWNSRIYVVESFYWQPGTGWVYTNQNSKNGHSWSVVPHTNYTGLFRYHYTLDDDPATTTGTKIGFVDIKYNTGKCTPNTIGTVSNPKTLCIGESWDLRAATINNNGGSFINLPFPELQDNITVTGTGVSGTTFTSNTAGTYNLNVKVTYDNGEENFPISVKVLANPLAQNATNFKYGDGIIGGSTATQLEICQGDKSLNTTTIANTFFNNTSNTFYGSTAPSEFSWGLKQGSTIGAYVATGTSKNNTLNYSTLAPGDYFMEMYHSFAPSTSTICTSKQYYFKVVVKPLPSNIVVTKDTFSICNNKESVNLTANTVSPTGVTWSGSGVSNNMFTGTSVSPNTYLITGTLTGTNGCSRLDTVIVINKAGVSLSAITSTPSICKNTSSINLNDLIIVADKGGKHSNPLYASTISNDSIFTPSIVDFHNLRYIKTVANGCSDTISYSVKVNPLPTAPTYQKNYDSVCIVSGGATSNITLTNFYNIASASGTTGSWAGANQSSGIVDINSLAVGTYSYMYIQKTASLCLDTTVFTLKANNGSSSLIQFTKNFDTVCHSSGNINLELYNKVVKGGTWSYTPNSIQSNVLLSTFIPINTIENITYTADTLGCSMQKTLSLYRFKPAASAGLDKNVCSNGSPVLLQGNPLGGSWKLDSIGQNVLVFDPKTFSVTQSNEARAYNLYYTITSNGCSNTDTAIYTIILKPKIQYVKRDDSICSSINTLNLTNNYGVNPNTGIWEGNNLNNADFSITSSGPGLKNFKYIFQSQYGCYDTTFYTLRVDQKDSTGLFEPNDYKVCEASAPINLNTFKLVPSTGLYSSLGGNNNIIDSLFYPTTSGVGTFTINYSTSNKSCQYNLSKKIFVVAKPSMPEFNGKTKACTNENLQFSVKNPDQTYSYFWDNNTSASNSYSTIAGNKTVKLFSKNYLGCKSLDNNIQLSLDDPSGNLSVDKSEISNSSDVKFSINNIQNTSTINWNFGDQSDVMTTNNVNTLIHRFYNPSTTNDVEYQSNIELVSNSNCRLILNNTKIKVLKRTVNSISNITKFDLSIYPNPFTEYISIDNKMWDKFNYIITDMIGKVISIGTLDPGTNTINLYDLSKGIYNISINNSEMIESFKIVKE